MIKFFYKKIAAHRYGLSLFIYLGAAILTGMACVVFMKAFEFVHEHPLGAGRWSWLATPLLFLAAVELIRRFAPCADGAGIPQAIFASKHMSEANFKKLGGLVSLKTMAVKIAALLIGLWAGASTGREGPTVHIAACLFFCTTLAFHKALKLPFDMRSAVVAGGAAGLAAAFNTPLAGVTFAVEELSSDYFSNIKDMVLMAIIVAGLAAKTMTGDYVYFGRLGQSVPIRLWTVLSIAFLAGAAGAFFSLVLVEGRRRITGLRGWGRCVSIAALAFGVLVVAAGSGMDGITGPGNAAAQRYVEGGLVPFPGMFAASKMAATLFTYWSGIAGGIFAPCLSIGSAIGAWVGSWQHGPVGSCAIIGMAAFLAGTIQAPITSFVIIFEMTGDHQMLLPIMLAALIGHMTARTFKVRHLYQALAGFYDGMLKPVGR